MFFIYTFLVIHSSIQPFPFLCPPYSPMAAKKLSSSSFVCVCSHPSPTRWPAMCPRA